MFRRIRQSNDRGTNISADGDVNIHIQGQAPSIPISDPLTVHRSSVADIADRFLKVFEWHGIAVGQIPKFLDQFGGPPISFGDLSSKESLLRRLDDKLLDFAQELFALDYRWLRVGSPSPVLRANDFDKNIRGLARFLLVNSALRSGGGFWPGADVSLGYGLIDSSLYMVANRRPLVHRGDSTATEAMAQRTGDLDRNYVGAIFKARLGEFEGTTVHRYFPIRPVPWSYSRTRYETVAMMSVADECGALVLGILAPGQDLFDLCAGRRFPTEIAKTDNNTITWQPSYPYFGYDYRKKDPAYNERWARYLEDFIDLKYEESVHEAKSSLRKLRSAPRGKLNTSGELK